MQHDTAGYMGLQMVAPADNRIQSRVPLYHKWVIEQLVSHIGRNSSDVIARIIGEWIKEQETWLLEKRISFDQFSAEQNPSPVSEAPVADTTGVVLSYRKDRAQEDER